MLAGAGTGKTAALTARLAHIIATRRPGHQAPALNDRFHPPATPQIMRKNWNNYSPISHDSYRSATNMSGRGRRVRAKSPAHCRREIGREACRERVCQYV